jgi:hypothetical protein
MPRKSTTQRAQEEAPEGEAPTTQPGEFVREEIKHIREGKHGARSPKQAIAIGLSKARRAGVKLPPPKRGRTSEAARRKAERDIEKGQKPAGARKPSARRSRATTSALKREGRGAASKSALSRQSRGAASARKKRGQATPRRGSSITREARKRSGGPRRGPRAEA